MVMAYDDMRHVFNGVVPMMRSDCVRVRRCLRAAYYFYCLLPLPLPCLFQIAPGCIPVNAGFHVFAWWRPDGGFLGILPVETPTRIGAARCGD